MDKQTFNSDFINEYRKLLSTCSHDRIKEFNRKLKQYAYLLVYPFTSDDHPDKIQVLVGFADTYAVHQMDDDDKMPDAMAQIKGSYDFLLIGKDFVITETVAIPVSEIEPVALRKVEWAELINAPKLDDGDFGILESSFLAYFSLDSHAYQENGERFDFSDYFEDKNKPAELELREVWRDVDSGEKYGDIQTLVIWKGDFIGWVSCFGKWLDNYGASTVDVDKWADLMNTLYARSGFVPGRIYNGVTVYSMEKNDVEDVAFVPGVSDRNYDDDDND